MARRVTARRESFARARRPAGGLFAFYVLKTFPLAAIRRAFLVASPIPM